MVEITINCSMNDYTDWYPNTTVPCDTGTITWQFNYWMSCPHCGLCVDCGDKYCKHCGKLLYPPQYCPHCGKKFECECK